MRILQIFGAILLLVATPAIAKNGTDIWILTQKSGDVRVLKSGLQPASVQVRAALSPGDLVSTGADGRAMLTRGDDYVVVAPSSRLMLPKEEQASGFTRLIQQVGTMLYKVRHTGVPHFAVETPMLAAVVKGTSFTVIVDQHRTAVQVTEGIVEVSAAAGDARRLVESGVTVYVGRERPHEIIEVKPGAVDLPSSGGNSDVVKIESSGDVPLATIANLTGGLVREAPVAPVVAATATPAPASGSPGVPVAAPASPVTPTDATTPTGNSTPTVTEPVTEVADTVVPTVTEPVAEVVDTTVPTVTEPLVEVVDTIVPAVTEPVAEVVDTIVPTVTEPFAEVVDITVPTVTEPLVEVVDTIVPTVTEPVAEVVDTIVPTVTEPVVEVVDTIVPAVTEPVVEVVDTIVPTVTEPLVEVVDTIVPTVTEPLVEVVDTTVPTVSEPIVEVVDTVLSITSPLGGL